MDLHPVFGRKLNLSVAKFGGNDEGNYQVDTLILSVSCRLIDLNQAFRPHTKLRFIWPYVLKPANSFSFTYVYCPQIPNFSKDRFQVHFAIFLKFAYSLHILNTILIRPFWFKQ
jgi:hypothetical protein